MKPADQLTPSPPPHPAAGPLSQALALSCRRMDLLSHVKLHEEVRAWELGLPVSIYVLYVFIDVQGI